MRSIGIVRRLDELGRVVIPREFRKTYRIEVGDPLEISATDEGKIIIGKIDYATDMIQQGQASMAMIYEELGLVTALSSFDHFVLVEGNNKNLLNKQLPAVIIKSLRNRNSYNGAVTNEMFFDTGFSHFCYSPVLGLDDCLGGLFAFSNKPIPASNALTIKIGAKILGDSVQKY